MKFKRLKYVPGLDSAPDIFVRLQERTPAPLKVYATDHTWQGALFRRARDGGDAMFAHRRPVGRNKHMPLRSRMKLRWEVLPPELRRRLEGNILGDFGIAYRAGTTMRAAR